MKKLILGLLLSIISFAIFAGDKGNGGGAYYCQNDKGEVKNANET